MKKWIVPLLIMGVLVIAGCSTGGSDTPNSGEVKEFNVVAKQFEFVPATITVKKGDTVRLIVESIDVNHGVAIPQFGVNVQVPVGAPQTIEFVADQVGEFPLICSVYCGAGHMQHRGMLVVE